MAEIQESGRGRKKNFEPNLVPFIDLMSVLITFLLITAVWTQVSMIQIGTSIYGKKDASKPPPQVPDQSNVVLKLDIRADGYILTIAKQIIKMPMVGTEYDVEGLIGHLTKAKEQYPAKNDGSIAMSDDLPYEQLIHGMDAMLKSGFGQISVLTGGPN